jgi:hypothetical protein
LNGCRIVPQTGAVFNIISSRHITITGGSYPAPASMFVKVFGETSEHIRLVGVDISKAKKAVELDPGVKSDAVIQE